MANINTDLTEEDAADLQFPKDRPDAQQSCSSLAKFVEKNEYCANCFCELGSEYILCEKCNANICLQCFSIGAEFSDHTNDHNYKILSKKFILFENSDWTADEELKLLDALIAYSNWNLVALEFPNRTVTEIKEHYEYFYLDGNGHKLIPKYKQRDSAIVPDIIVPYRIKLTDCEDPPRHSCNTLGYQTLAGYNPARGDFECEYDKNAEDIMSKLKAVESSHPKYELMSNMHCAIAESYNRRLRERQRWKRIISQHGLLLQRKVHSWLRRYYVTITKPVYEKMLRFLQYCGPQKFVEIMEGLHRVGELRMQIQRLTQLRRKGITTLAEAKMYTKLEQIHENNKKELKIFRSKPQFDWKAHKGANLYLSKTPKQRRAMSTPIDIIGMPGYEKLTEKERDTCSSIRLVPATYLELKGALIAENNKLGFVKLQTARAMLKIDVNKTRRLYDFLVAEGYINKPDS